MFGDGKGTGAMREPRKLPGVKIAHGGIPGKGENSGILGKRETMGHTEKEGNNGILGKGILGFPAARQLGAGALPSSRGFQAVVGVN